MQKNGMCDEDHKPNNHDVWVEDQTIPTLTEDVASMEYDLAPTIET